MAWIESHQSLGEHPKLFKLAGELNITPAQAIGHLSYIWWWALTYALNGDVSKYIPIEIAAAAKWVGDAAGFCKTLQNTGWIDEGGTIHDWSVYTSKWRKCLERVRRFRKNRPGAGRWHKIRAQVLMRDSDTCRYCGDVGTVVDHVIPASRGGQTIMSNLVASCARCNSQKGSKLLTETDIKIGNVTETLRLPLTKPNLTKPNITFKEESVRSRFKKPTPEQVQAYAQQLGFVLDGQLFCDHYEANGWHVGRNPMKNWQAAVRNWKKRGGTSFGKNQHNAPIVGLTVGATGGFVPTKQPLF